MTTQHVLRNFLYLDKQMVDDFLAGIEGALYDESLVQTQEKSSSLSGEAGIQVLKGGGKTESKETTETTKQAQLTDAAKFQRLYAHLEHGQAFGYYETMDSETWITITRSSLLEVTVNISLSKMGAMSSLATTFTDLTNVIETVTGQSLIDKKTEESVRGFQQFAKMMETEKGIPVIMSLLGSPEYRFVTYLNPDVLRVARDRLVGEVTIFCKVQRKIGKGEQINLFDPLSMLNTPSFNREQRRRLAKSKPPQAIQDTIKAPAAIVIPVAIYR